MLRWKIRLVLFFLFQLLAEFQRVHGGAGVVELLEKGLAKYAQGLSECFKGSKVSKGEVHLAATWKDENKGKCMFR